MPQDVRSEQRGNSDRRTGWRRAADRWLAVACLGASALGGLILSSIGCTDSAPPPPPKQSSLKLEELLAQPSDSGGDSRASEGVDSDIRLRTMVDTGIDFHHQSGNSDERPFPAANGSGVAAFDYDLDGHADLFFANGTKFPVDLGNRQHVDALYRNRSQWQFQKVSAVSGVDYSGYSAGVTVGDYNHDGFPDLYVTCYGENRLYENQGDGSFLERAELAGVNDSNWGTSAVWFDLNNDGLLDLYVGNYGIWSLETNKFCHGHRQDIRIFCSPTSVDPAPDFLFLNRGDGTFEDISAASQVTRRMSRTQGVLAADFNGDGWVDLYLGNDMHANSLFLNRQDGTFADETDVSGVGYSSDGKTQAGMGVAVADVNHNLDLEIFVTNYMAENNNLYQQRSPGRYGDQSNVQGLAADSLSWVGWGTAFVDLDLDRWPDLIVTNGHTDDNKPNQPYAQPAFVWQNNKGRFNKISSASGDYLAGTHVGRGLAVVDLDNDGRPDLAFAHLGFPPAVVRNETPTEQPWVLELEGAAANRDAVGATVTIKSTQGTTIHHRVGGGSYLSHSESRMWIPYESGGVQATIRWQDGQTSMVDLDTLPRGQTLVLRQVP